MPWETLIKPVSYFPFVTPFDNLLTIGFVVLGIFAFFRLHPRSYGIYSLLIVFPPLMSGTLRSSARYCVVIFPVFIMLALLGKKYSVHQFITILFFTLQILFMVAWSNFYWIA